MPEEHSLPLFGVGKDDIAQQSSQEAFKNKGLEQGIFLWAHMDTHSKVSSGLANPKLLLLLSIYLSFIKMDSY